MKLQYFISKINKKRFYDPVSYFLSNFMFFFSKEFKHNLQNKQRLSYFYGKLRKRYLKKIVKWVLKNLKKTNIHPTILFIMQLEARLDTILYRTHFCYSLNNARQLVLHKKVYVNHKIMQHYFFSLKKGDLITFDYSIINIITSTLLKSKMWPTPPKHLYINYKTFQILVIEDIQYDNYSTYYSFLIDFNSFIRYYTK